MKTDKMKSKKNIEKPAEIKLRVFKINNTDIKKEHSDVKRLLSEKLEKTIIKERGMSVNEGDPLKETDYIAYYDVSKENITFGAMVKTIASEDAPNITQAMMDKNKIVISNLNHVGAKTNIVKYLYYFAMNDDYLVTNLRAQQLISSFQTYVNWLLAEDRGDNLYTFQPVIVKQQINNMHNVRGIRFSSQGIKSVDHTKNNNQSPTTRIIKNIQKDLLASIIPKDTPNLEEIMNEDFISAEILLKFATKKKDKADFEATMGILLSNISDPDNVSLDTKMGKIKLGDVEYKETVSIQKTESGLLSEQELYQNMEKILNSLK